MRFGFHTDILKGYRLDYYKEGYIIMKIILFYNITLLTDKDCHFYGFDTPHKSKF